MNKELPNSVWFCGYVDGNGSKGVDHMHKKRGKVWDWTTTVTSTGLTIETNAGGFKSLEHYK